MKKTPRISVVVPAYNVDRFIAATLDSIQSQTVNDYEVIVVDDASIDGTIDIVQAREREDSRIRLVRHEKNQGVAVARNTGISHSRGEYIAFLDSDDVAFPTRFEEQAAALDADASLGMVGSQVAVMNEAGDLTGRLWHRPVNPDEARIQLLFRNTFSAVMMVRKAAIPAGGFRNMEVAEDYDFNVRIAKCAKVMNINKPLTMVRVRRGGLTHTKYELMERFVREVMRELLRELGIDPTERELSLNRHVGGMTLPNSVEVLSEVDAWLLKLVFANQAVGKYPDAKFRRVLGLEWFEVCKFAAPLGFSAWRIWKSSMFHTYGPREPAALGKFWVKCLLKHKRAGGDSPHVR